MERIVLTHPADRMLTRIAWHARVSGAILPSGFQVPGGRDGLDWVVVGEGVLELRKWK